MNEQQARRVDNVLNSLDVEGPNVSTERKSVFSRLQPMASDDLGQDWDRRLKDIIKQEFEDGNARHYTFINHNV